MDIRRSPPTDARFTSWSTQRLATRQYSQMNLDTIYFEVGDSDAVDKAVRFYSEHFALEVTSAEEGESAWMRAGALTLGFHVGDAPSNPWTFNLGFSVGDVDAEVDRLENAGVGISVAPYDAPWGRAASLVDPNGFTVWLTQK